MSAGRATQALLVGEEPSEERLREHQADFTPEPVVRQALSLMAHRITDDDQRARRQSHGLINCRRKPRILDIGAGGGVFGKVAREIWPHAEIVAVENRPEEFGNLCRHYDEVWTMPIATFASGVVCHPGTFELVVGNPPWRSDWGDCALLGLSLLAYRGKLLLLGPSTWGHSEEGAERADVFRMQPPAAQWRIHGRIAFRGGAAADNRKCSWWVWREGDEQHPLGGPCWIASDLPELPREDRRWRVRPGTE